MARNPDKEAKKIQLVQKRWEELQRREEEKKKRLAQRGGKPHVALRIIRWLNRFFQAVADFLLRPLHAIHDSLTAARKAREARKLAKKARMQPILEAKAHKRIEKKRLKEAKKEARRLAKEARRKNKEPFMQRLIKSMNKSIDAFFRLLAQPGHAWQRMQARGRQKKFAKKQAKLEKTAASRERKAQKKHLKLARKAQKRTARERRRRERWRRVREKWSKVEEFWAYTVVVRRYLILAALLVLAYVKRDFILEKINSWMGYDLQNLIH